MSGPKTAALAAAWKVLDETSAAWAEERSKPVPNAETRSAFVKAALAYAAAYMDANPQKARALLDSKRAEVGSVKMPFGASKGSEVRHTSTPDLKWARSYLHDGRDSWPDVFAESNQTLLDAIESELRFRGEA